MIYICPDCNFVIYSRSRGKNLRLKCPRCKKKITRDNLKVFFKSESRDVLIPYVKVGDEFKPADRIKFSQLYSWLSKSLKFEECRKVDAEIISLLKHKPMYSWEVSKEMGISPNKAATRIRILHEKGLVKPVYPFKNGKTRKWFAVV